MSTAATTCHAPRAWAERQRWLRTLRDCGVVRVRFDCLALFQLSERRLADFRRVVGVPHTSDWFLTTAGKSAAAYELAHLSGEWA